MNEKYFEMKNKLLGLRADWFVKEFQRFALKRDIDLMSVMHISKVIKSYATTHPISNKEGWMLAPQNFKYRNVPKKPNDALQCMEEQIKLLENDK